MAQITKSSTFCWELQYGEEILGVDDGIFFIRNTDGIQQFTHNEMREVYDLTDINIDNILYSFYGDNARFVRDQYGL